MKLAELSNSFKVNDITDVIFSDKRFYIWSGSSSPQAHHYGKGKLLEHTTEVVELCLLNNDYWKGSDKHIDPKIVYLAALFHDVGKMDDYAPTNADFTEWTVTKHKYSIHHISKSALMWHDCAKHMPFHDEVLHAILAHHGCRAFGSPVEPQTRLAWLLHLSDSMSAHYDSPTFHTFPVL